MDTSAFKGIFEEVIRDRRGLRGDLENAIRTAGGTPDEDGTMLASAHRVLMRLRDAVSKGDIAVVDEAERGEDHIKAKFAKAREDGDLSPDVRQFVTTAAARVKAGHDRIRDLKHSLHGKQIALRGRRRSRPRSASRQQLSLSERIPPVGEHEQEPAVRCRLGGLARAIER